MWGGAFLVRYPLLRGHSARQCRIMFDIRLPLSGGGTFDGGLPAMSGVYMRAPALSLG